MKRIVILFGLIAVHSCNSFQSTYVRYALEGCFQADTKESPIRKVVFASDSLQVFTTSTFNNKVEQSHWLPYSIKGDSILINKNGIIMLFIILDGNTILGKKGVVGVFHRL